MATTEQQLDSFMQFVRNRVGAGDSEASLDELFDLWRHENPSDELYAENVAAIAASIEDLKRGERGTVVGEHSAELRREFGLPDK
jgi:hypothetical protein